MRKTKNTLTAIGIVLAVVLVGTWAFAHWPWGRMGYGYPGPGYGYYWNLPPEQREKLRAQQEKFFKETAEFRRELYQKSLELQGLLVDPKAEPEKLKVKEGEVFDQKRKLQEKAFEFRRAIRELIPEKDFGPGPWGGGFGMGYGPGPRWGHIWGPWFGPGRGYGAGPRW